MATVHAIDWGPHPVQSPLRRLFPRDPSFAVDPAMLTPPRPGGAPINLAIKNSI